MRSVEGQIDGEKDRNRQIIDKCFPIHASWFTGKIFVAVGYFDYEANTSNYVLEFDIEDGNVRSTSFHEALQIPYTWNGLASEMSDEGGTEQSPVTEPAPNGEPPRPAR